MIFLGCSIGADAGFYVRLAEIEGQSGFYYTEHALAREQTKKFWENASDGILRCFGNPGESDWRIGI